MKRSFLGLTTLVLVLLLTTVYASRTTVANPAPQATLTRPPVAYLPGLFRNCLDTPTPSVYYGVYVPGWFDNLDALTTFETDAKKNVSIVMWYQGWGLRDGT